MSELNIPNADAGSPADTSGSFLDGIKESDIIVDGQSLSGESSTEESLDDDTDVDPSLDEVKEDSTTEDSERENSDEEPKEGSSDEDQKQEQKEDSDKKKDPKSNENTPEAEGNQEEKDPESTPVDINQELDRIIDERSKGEFGNIDELFDAVSNRVELKDDYIRKAVEYYGKNGTLAPFLDATRHNFKDMSSLEIMRYKFDKEHEGMSQEARQRKFEREVLVKYQQDGNEDYDDDDVRLGKEEMDFEAKKIKDSLIKEQQEFLQPAQTEKFDKENSDQRMPKGPSREELIQVAKNAISEHFQDNTLKIKVGDTEIAFDNMDMDKLAEMAVDNNAISKVFWKNNGKNVEVKWNDFAEGMYFLLNKEKYRKQLLDTGKSLGREETQNELKNPKETSSQRTLKPNIDAENPDFSDPNIQEAFLRAGIEQQSSR